MPEMQYIRRRGGSEVRKIGCVAWFDTPEAMELPPKEYHARRRAAMEHERDCLHNPADRGVAPEVGRRIIKAWREEHNGRPPTAAQLMDEAHKQGLVGPMGYEVLDPEVPDHKASILRYDIVDAEANLVALRHRKQRYGTIHPRRGVTITPDADDGIDALQARVDAMKAELAVLTGEAKPAKPKAEPKATKAKDSNADGAGAKE